MCGSRDCGMHPVPCFLDRRLAELERVIPDAALVRSVKRSSPQERPEGCVTNKPKPKEGPDE